jgi:hypothetical protein
MVLSSVLQAQVQFTNKMAKAQHGLGALGAAREQLRAQAQVC